MKNLKTISTLVLLATLVTPSTSSANALDYIFGSGSFGRKSGTTGDCGNILQRYLENRRFFKDTTWKDRVVTERDPNYLNDMDYMEEMKYTNSTLGLVDTKFVKEFDTQIYYTSTAKPRPDGTIPEVDPEAKALVVYFHGSGTMKASGVGFAGKMNSLSKMGYSSLSFDLPFHRLGSKNPALADPKNFAEYVDKIIQKYKVEGQPVILVGHSFGPDVIAEYVTRFPHSVDSAVLVSPGSFDKATTKWYNEKTTKMDFGDTEMNDEGGRWAGMVTNGKIWSDPKAPGRVDPTIANKDLKIHVISGDKEEYIPGELDARGMPTDKPREYDVQKAFNQYFSRVDVTIEPGVGHYIFNHRDAQGQDVVLRSVLKADGESLANEKELKKAMAQRMAQRGAQEVLATRYTKEPFFRKWVDAEAKKQGTTGASLVETFMKTEDKKTAQSMLTNFMTVERQRVEVMNKNIKATANWAPDFYAENKAAIDTLGDKGVDQTGIQAKYHAYLKTLPESQVNAHAVSGEDVFVLPVKAERPPRPEGEQGQRPPRPEGDRPARPKQDQKEMARLKKEAAKAKAEAEAAAAQAGTQAE